MKKKETSCIILILVDGFGASIRKVDSVQLIPDGLDLCNSSAMERTTCRPQGKKEPFTNDKDKLFLAIVIILDHFLWPLHNNFSLFRHDNASPEPVMTKVKEIKAFKIQQR